MIYTYLWAFFPLPDPPSFFPLSRAFMPEVSLGAWGVYEQAAGSEEQYTYLGAFLPLLSVLGAWRLCVSDSVFQGWVYSPHVGWVGVISWGLPVGTPAVVE
jgi:hypothetical protein